jgi:hypothetical protein
MAGDRKGRLAGIAKTRTIPAGRFKTECLALLDQAPARARGVLDLVLTVDTNRC